jgi:transposase
MRARSPADVAGHRVAPTPGRPPGHLSPRSRSTRVRGARSRPLPAAPIEAVERIDALFAIEREINGLTPRERVRARHARSRPLVIPLESWLREQRSRVSKNSEIGKAIDYSLKRWIALTRFLDDGRLCMSNKAAERELRAVAVPESLCIPSNICKHWNRVGIGAATRATFSGHRRFDRFRRHVVRESGMARRAQPVPRAVRRI